MHGKTYYISLSKLQERFFSSFHFPSPIEQPQIYADDFFWGEGKCVCLGMGLGFRDESSVGWNVFLLRGVWTHTPTPVFWEPNRKKTTNITSE